MCQYEQLPAYTAFLLTHHLDAYTKESIRQSFAMDIPLLRFFRHLPDQEMYELSKGGNIELLTKLSENKGKEHMDDAMHQWLNNQLPQVDKYDIKASDITLVNHVRTKVLKSFFKQYSSDIDVLLKLNSEIDDYILEYNTTFTDAYITLLKEKIEEEVHFSTNLVNASPGITFIYDLEAQREVYINGKVEEIMGTTTEEVLAMENLTAQLTHPEDMPVVSNFIGEVIADRENKTHQAEYRFRGKDGNYHWMRCYAVVYKRNEAGKPMQLLGSAFEISNEKEIAGALLKREKQLLEAQSIACIGSFDWDMVADTSISSPQLRKIFEAEAGQKYEELLQKVHPDDKEKLISAMEEAYRTGEYQCEYRYVTAKGEKVIDARGVISFDEEGIPLLMTGTVQDITERKAVENQLFQKTIELEHSNERLQEFAAVASHDLKEPLRKIGMFSNLIMTSDGDNLCERTKSYMQKIVDATARMQQLIEDILSFSSFQADGKKQLESLEAILKESLNNLEYRIKNTNAEITFDRLPKAMVIPFQMQQLFQNLIGNALKFSKKEVPPQIKVVHEILMGKLETANYLLPAKKYLKIKVQDNGIGFRSDAAEKIFALFQRLHSKHSFEGSGIGLAICKKIVENHGGVIYATSKEGEGSTFTIILPYDDLWNI